MDNSIEKIKALEELLLDEDFIILISKTGRLNVFNALQLQNQEIRHSNFLAWLLNPNESHKLGDAFLKELLQIVLKEYSKNPEITIKLFDIILNDFNDAQVEREKRTNKGRYIDIFIESKSNKFVCVIENKVWTKDTNNQLEHYQTYIDSKNYKHKLFIYLAPNPSNDYGGLYKNYMCLSYEKVCQAIDNLLKRQTNAMCDKIRYFIEDYKEMVERNIMDNVDYKDFALCVKIYNKHREAIDMINKVNKNIINRINKILQEVVKENSLLALETCKGKWVRFIVSNKINYKIAKKDWVKSDNILMIEIKIERENIRADIIIRQPKKDDNAKQQRDKLIDVAKEFFKYEKNNDLYAHIYSVKLFNENDEQCKYYEFSYEDDSELKEVLSKKLYESKILEEYEKFIDEANKQLRL